MIVGNMDKQILVDGRWQGACGIGRVSYEIISRLQHIDIIKQGPKPLSVYNLLWQPRQLKKNYRLFYTPGFNPILHSPIPYVLTIHDLIYLQSGRLKKTFFNYLVKPSILKAAAIFTVSHYSKQQLCEWVPISPEKIHVIYNGVSKDFTDDGLYHRPGYPYFLYVGNSNPHKNLPRLLKAFSIAKLDTRFKLILITARTNELSDIIHTLRLNERVVFEKATRDTQLAEYYRGATALCTPSLQEGFGLPALEAMASGTPVLAANATSLPEITADAALLCDPLCIDSIASGIEKLALDATIRDDLIKKGLTRSALFTWDNTARSVQQLLGCIVN
jgi:glycosyltransferase involved in cell wall biosynthesis